MKLKLNIFQKITTAFFILIIISSCTKNNDEQLLNENPLSKVDVNFIGKEHNKGLDYVLAKIKQDNKNFSRRSISEFSTLVEQYSKEYAIKNGLTQEDSKLILFYDNTIHISSRTSEEENLMVNSNFSPELQDLLDDLHSLSDSDKNDWEISDFLNYISDLENQANNLGLSDEEKFIFFSGTTVAKNSLEYWNNNIAEWAELFEDSKGNRMSAKSLWDEFNWGAIGISDAAGAVGMAARLVVSGSGAAMAATGPGGWVGIGLVVAAGAIGSSATAFAAQAMTM